MKLLVLLLTALFTVGFRESTKFKMPLSKKEEEKYLDLYSKTKDDEARNILIERNLRLVANIAKKYTSNKHELEDLISIGTIGLIKGIDTFKNENGNKLSTYISRCIENEILMFFRKEKKTGEDLYLEDIKCSDKDGNGMKFIDTLIAEDNNLEETVYDNINFEIIGEVFEKVLTKTEQEILKKRYGIFGCNKQTQERISKDLNISRSYVSRIEKSALNKLSKVINLKKEL